MLENDHNPKYYSHWEEGFYLQRILSGETFWKIKHRFTIIGSESINNAKAKAFSYLPNDILFITNVRLDNSISENGELPFIVTYLFDGKQYEFHINPSAYIKLIKTKHIEVFFI